MSEELVALIECPRCGMQKPADSRDKHICADCAKVENSRCTYYRQHQGDWMAAAADAGIDVWLQQPGETQWEYTIWTAYRDSYPGRKPTYASVAEQLNTTYSVVKHIAQRWTFQARMQAWMTECDRLTLAQRHTEILNMNAEHISMAQRLRDKLSVAIDYLNPSELKPTDIATLAKLSSELERKARVDDLAQDEALRALTADNENPNLKKSPTKQGDLSEVVQILMSAGALGNITQIGVRETTTTTRETIMRDDNGNSSKLLEEE